jgi:AcrR family transcriptional regulator
MMQTDPTLSPLKLARRDKLLDVAERLFVTQGFRATTIEGLAEAAGLSKVTVYGYFADKDAVFEAVALRLADRMRAVALGMLQMDASVADRAASALIAKHGLIFDLVRTSPFAAELDQELIVIVGDTLDDHALAKLLFDAAMGIANGAASRAEMERDVGRLVHRFLG